MKGLRGCKIKAGKIGPLGFEDDRTYCLQKIHRDPETKEIKIYETMYSGFHLRMVLFATHVEQKQDGEKYLVITWTGPENPKAQAGESLPYDAQSEHQIRFPLRPSVEARDKVHLDLHGADTDAYSMGIDINTWFSKYLGFEAMLVYIGDNSRPVLGSIAPNGPLAQQKSLPPLFLRLRQALLLPFTTKRRPERISFADIGQYHIVTKESNDEVTRRVREEQGAGSLAMDVTKFRPNIVVSGSSAPFDEDYWAELTFAHREQAAGGGGKGIRMAVTANCWRCQSITVDFATGRPTEDARGLAWKKLNRDRRVDAGWKYGPVFGRYAFCDAADVGREICLGDEVALTKRWRERTTFGELHVCFGLTWWLWRRFYANKFSCGRLASEQSCRQYVQVSSRRPFKGSKTNHCQVVFLLIGLNETMNWLPQRDEPLKNVVNGRIELVELRSVCLG